MVSHEIRRSYAIIESLMEENRGPNEGEYKELLDHLKVNHERHAIVWPGDIDFASDDTTQTRIDKMANTERELLARNQELLERNGELLTEICARNKETIARNKETIARNRETLELVREARRGE
jgi:hypothetical protein